MSRGGAMPMARPTGWVYLPWANCTIRWRDHSIPVAIIDTFRAPYAGEPLGSPWAPALPGRQRIP
jgi:hypothetical protein